MQCIKCLEQITGTHAMNAITAKNTKRAPEASTSAKYTETQTAAHLTGKHQT